MTTETVLVVGSTGNIGVAAIHGARKAGRNVLAIVRNQDSAAKLAKHVGTEGITTVEADVMSADGVKGVVEQVKAGKLPAFQHVYATVGGGNFFAMPLHEQSAKHLQETMAQLFEANMHAYLATIPYLLSQAPADTSFTVCIGGALDLGYGGTVPASQGALLGMVNAAMHDLKDSNVRVVEAWLSALVRYDAEVKDGNAIPASEYGKVYERVLNDTSLKGTRSSVYGPQDISNLRFETKMMMKPKDAAGMLGEFDKAQGGGK